MACGCKNKAEQGKQATTTQQAAENRRAQLREVRAKEQARENAKK